MTQLPLSLADVRDESRGDRFPRHLLPECKSALVLFAAGFYGANDAYWLADAGLEDVVCVDRDAEKIEAMRAIYPERWRFYADDWWNFLLSWTRCDLIVADPPTALFVGVVIKLPMILGLASKAVVFTTSVAHTLDIAAAAPGWDLSLRQRTGDVCWAVLTR